MTRFLLVIISCLSVSLSVSAQMDMADEIGGDSKVSAGLTYCHDWDQGLSDAYSARISYNFLKTSHFSFTAGGRYVISDASFSEGDISHMYNPSDIHINGTHGVFQLGLTALYRTTLFEKPFVGAAIVNSDWSAGGFAKVTGILMGMIMLRADKDTQFGLGPLFLINTNGHVPALVTFMFRHRFNDKWRLNFSGGLFAMEYTPTIKDRITMGVDIDAKSFYFRPKMESLPKKLRFMSVSFRPMVKYTRNIVDNLNMDVRAGLSINIVDRVNGVNGTRKYIDFDQPTVYPFVQATASYSF